MEKKFLSFLILVTFSCILIGQNLEGTYLSKYGVRITNEHIRNEPYSVFYNVNFIFDFISKDSLAFKTLGDTLVYLKYKFENGKLELKIKDASLYGTIIDNQLILTNTDSEKYTRIVYLEKIQPSYLDSCKMPDYDMFFNTNWLIETTSESKNFGINYTFLEEKIEPFDKNKVIINKCKGDYGFTDEGIFILDSYKNHLFLGIYNYESLDESVFHFYNLEKSTFYARTYEFGGNWQKPPRIKELKLSKKKFKTPEEIKKMEANLVGKWSAVSNPIPFNSSSSEFEKLEDQSYELEFKEDKTFKILKKGVFMKNGRKNPKKQVVRGIWKIGNTGQYIELMSKNLIQRYMTINTLTKDSLKVFYVVKVLDENSVYSRSFIEFVK